MEAPSRSSPVRTILLLGPTGGGKSALAMALASRVEAEIVSADSMQLYRGMDIGTAKPSVDERQRVRHHMIDVADPHHDAPTVSDWLAGAHTAIEAIHARKHVAIVVGGTNLYLRALIDGLATIPPADESIRAELSSRTTADLRDELMRIDPAAASRIHANDTRRTIRALEVARLTGQSISAHQEQWGSCIRAVPGDWLLVGLAWPVDLINRRIHARVKDMMKAGFLEEVRGLATKGPLLHQARAAVGYEELLAHLEGTLSLEEAVERIAIRTRRYAKQQRTWLKRFRVVPSSLWLEASDGDPVRWSSQVADNLNF